MLMNTDKERICVLLVDDDPADRRLVEMPLKQTCDSVVFEVTAVGTLSEAVRHLEAVRSDIVLLDLGLPDSYGLETVQKVHEVSGDVPVIVLTGAADSELALEAIRNGAEDYLVKGKSLEFALVRIIRYAVERKRAERNLSKLLKDLEDTNRELNDFASIVSHDLKAPLRGIKTLAEWIMEDNIDRLTEEGKEQMELLADRVDRMHKLIDGILHYSRVGRQKEQTSTVHLDTLVPEIWDMLSAPVDIHFCIEGELPVVVCEHTRISQVFQNLLSNAVKYMDKPEGRVRVGCVEDEDMWKFHVSDNGPGIAEKYYEKIFKMFQTLSATDAFESTGVGLTVVKKIVEMYGGGIWLESEVGAGTTFYFTFPKQHVEAGCA